MAVTYTNNWKNILTALQSKIRAELKQKQEELSEINNTSQENTSLITTLEIQNNKLIAQNKNVSIDFEITKQKLIEEKNKIQNLKNEHHEIHIFLLTSAHF